MLIPCLRKLHIPLIVVTICACGSTAPESDSPTSRQDSSDGAIGSLDEVASTDTTIDALDPINDALDEVINTFDATSDSLDGTVVDAVNNDGPEEVTDVGEDSELVPDTPEADTGEGPCVLEATDCPSGFVLRDNTCVVGCNGGCPFGEACLAGVCMPESGAHMYDACETSDECGDMVCEPVGSDFIPVDGRYCTYTEECSSDDDCPGGGKCFDLLGTCQRPCNPGAPNPCGSEDLLCTSGIPADEYVCLWRFDCVEMLEEHEIDGCFLYGSVCDEVSRSCGESTVSACDDGGLFCGAQHLFRCGEGGTELTCEEACGAEGICVDADCADCSDHAEQRCSDGDLFWYDSCGRQEEVAEPCERGCDEDGGCCESRASEACHDGDVYWFDSCGVREEVSEPCENYCSGSECVDTVVPQDGVWSGTNITFTVSGGGTSVEVTYADYGRCSNGGCSVSSERTCGSCSTSIGDASFNDSSMGCRGTFDSGTSASGICNDFNFSCECLMTRSWSASPR